LIPESSILIVCILVSALTGNPSGAGGNRIIADAAVQDSLERLVESGPETIAFYEEVLKLKNHARRSGYEHVVEQAALYCAERNSPKALRYVRWQLHREDRYRIVRYLLPYVESSDEQLRKFIEDHVLGEVWSGAADSAMDPVVRAMVDYVTKQQDNPPWRVVQILYRRAPSAALSVIGASWSEGDGAEYRALLRSERVIADAVWREAVLSDQEAPKTAVAELEKLSSDKRWWVRLYVAEILRRYDQFQRDDIVARLRRDTNALVASAVDAPNEDNSERTSGDEHRTPKLPPSGARP
jgi:hypothetical protein